MRRPRFGLTVLELVVLLFIAVVVVALFLVPVSTGPRNPRRVKDMAVQRQICMSMSHWAREYDGQFPLPGLVSRLPDPEVGRRVPGRGPQDYSLNHTAPLFSMMIAQNYMTPQLVVSPLEKSPLVVEATGAYNYESYDPAANSYWDNTFSADLRTTSNVSYAHMALCGERVEQYWRDTTATGIPLLGTRGPRDGATAGREYDRSITLLFIEPDDLWVGNIVLSDGSVQTFDKLEPPTLQQPGSQTPFNLFRMDGGALGVSIASTEDDVTRVWDPLQ